MASGNSLLTLFPADNEPPATNYATLDTRNGHPVLDFDTTTQETAIFTGVMPQHYAGGNLVVLLTWAATSATSGTIGWGVTFENMSGLDIDADGWATEQIVTAATVSGTAGIPSTTSVTCTAGATGTDSVAAGNTFRLRVRRDVANDSATGDSELISAEIREL